MLCTCLFSDNTRNRTGSRPTDPVNPNTRPPVGGAQIRVWSYRPLPAPTLEAPLRGLSLQTQRGARSVAPGPPLPQALAGAGVGRQGPGSN